MPIRAKPYQHQVDGFNFALKIFGVEQNESKEEIQEGGDADECSKE